MQAGLGISPSGMGGGHQYMYGGVAAGVKKAKSRDEFNIMQDEFPALPGSKPSSAKVAPVGVCSVRPLNGCLNKWLPVP